MANLSNINGKFVVDTAGNIGVGTLIPRSDANTTNISIQSSGTARLFVNNTGASGKEYAIYSSANGDFGIFDYGAVSARLVINSAGNATFAGNIYLADGTQRNIIGPTNQSLGLFSRPNNASEGIIFSTDGGTTTEMFIQDGGRVNIGPVNSDLPSALNIVSINNYNETGTGGRDTGGIIIRGGTTGDQNNTGGIGFAFGTGTAGISGYQNGTDADRVGLKFFTHGSGTGSAAAALSMIIKSGGEVGIGTDSPEAKLDISNVAGATYALEISTPERNRALFYYNSASTSDAGYLGIKRGSVDALNHRFATSGNSAVCIGVGNFGIGTDSPTAKLDIAGDVRYQGDIYSEYTYNGSGNYSSGTIYTIASTGQLTINGMYQLVMYLDDFGAGGSTYFSWFCSVPFYWVTTGTNRSVSQNLPPLIGTGHAIGTIPTFTITQELGTQGGQAKIRFNPQNNWTNINGTSGRKFVVYVKRLGG